MTCYTECMHLPVYRTPSISVEDVLAESKTDNKVTYELPSLFRDLVRIGDRFHECLVHNARFRYPDSTQEMYPVPEYGLLECTSFVWAQNA